MFALLTVAISAFLIQESLACAALPTPLSYRVKLTKLNLRLKYIQNGKNVTSPFRERMRTTTDEVKNQLQEDVQLAVNEAVEKMCKQHAVDSNQMATAKSQFKLKPPTTYTVLQCQSFTFPGASLGAARYTGNEGYGCLANEEMIVTEQCTMEVAVTNTDQKSICFAFNGTRSVIPDTFRTVNFDMDMSNYIFSTATVQQQTEFANQIRNYLRDREIIKDGEVIVSR